MHKDFCGLREAATTATAQEEAAIPGDGPGRQGFGRRLINWLKE